MEVFFLSFLFMVGVSLGSFVCCQAQRIRMKETKKKKFGNRSVCFSCGYQLRWYDNLPILSWIFLRGRCRKCRNKIGYLEFVSEVLMGLSFFLVGLSFGSVLSFMGIDWVYLFLVLALVSVLGFLAIYDGKWGELPHFALVIAVLIGLMICLVKQYRVCLIFGWSFDSIVDSLLSAIGGIGILAGVYFLLYFFSNEKLVGGGDWILGLAISLCLSNWWLSLNVMCISNLMAALIMVPFLKKNKNKKIFFGPWMIFAFVVVFICRNFFLKFLVF